MNGITTMRPLKSISTHEGSCRCNMPRYIFLCVHVILSLRHVPCCVSTFTSGQLRLDLKSLHFFYFYSLNAFYIKLMLP